MKFLILSCNTGEGHNSAAAAIKDYCTRVGASCVILDALAFESEKMSKMISNGHKFVYRHLPKVFGVGYRFEEREDLRFLSKIRFRGTKRLYRFITENDYDAVICVHVFSGLMMGYIRKHYELHIPHYFVATDYTCSPGVALSLSDIYFTPHPKNTEEFVSCGVPRDRIVPTGIPVLQKFCEKTDKTDARRKLGLPETGRMVLYVSGSMGCGPMEELVPRLSAQLPAGDFLTVICGNNKKLFGRLSRSYTAQNVYVLGYTKQMPLYQDAADLFLTKAGGLSTTEALTKHLPIVYVDAVPGCETRNFDFITQNGYAVGAGSVDGLIALICNLLDKPVKLEKMIEKYNTDFTHNAAREIYESIEADVTNRQGSHDAAPRLHE